MNRRRFIQLHLFIFNLVKVIILPRKTDTPTRSSLCFYSPERNHTHAQTHEPTTLCIKYFISKLAYKIHSNKTIVLIFNNLHCGFTKPEIIIQLIFNWIVLDFVIQCDADLTVLQKRIGQRLFFYGWKQVYITQTCIPSPLNPLQNLDHILWSLSWWFPTWNMKLLPK